MRCDMVARKTHGHCKGGKSTPEYMTWGRMKHRCYNPNNSGYRNYGGRGIKVCKRWENFEMFLSDMGPKPSKKHSIDRIDNDKGYSPSNCRWATKLQQARNKRDRLTVDGETKTRRQWMKRFGIPQATYYGRIKRNWTVIDALKTPSRAYTKAEKGRE